MHIVGGEIVSFLWASGLTGRVIAALGLLSLALSVASSLSLVVPPWRPAARRLGMATLFAAAAALSLASALAAAYRADAEALSAAAPTPALAAKATRDKYTQARVVSLGGLLLAAPALVAGAGAALSGGINLRPRRPERPPSKPPAKRTPAITLPLLLAILAAFVAALLAASAARTPIPGDELMGREALPPLSGALAIGLEIPTLSPRREGIRS